MAKSYLSCGQVARRYPGARSAATVSPATVSRWILSGVRVPDGTRIRLRAVRCGARWLIDEADLKEFVAAVTAANLPVTADATPRSPAERARAAAEAEQQLKARGC